MRYARFGDMKPILNLFLDTIYPPKCGICGTIGEPAICSQCRSKLKPLPAQRETVSPLASLHAPYLYDGEAGQAIQNLKFARITSLAEPMAHILWEYAEKELSGQYDVVIPVPIARTRKSERGFNQSELLCSAFPSDIVCPSYLKRTRYTKPQVNLDRNARLTNLKGAFQAQPLEPNCRVLLVDDVVTTGGTAVACAESLINKGAGEVHLLTFASQPLT